MSSNLDLTNLRRAVRLASRPYVGTTQALEWLLQAAEELIGQDQPMTDDEAVGLATDTLERALTGRLEDEFLRRVQTHGDDALDALSGLLERLRGTSESVHPPSLVVVPSEEDVA